MKLAMIPRSLLASLVAAGVLVLLMFMATAAANWKPLADEIAEPSPAAQCVEVMIIAADTAAGQSEPRSLFEFQKNGKTYRVARNGFFGNAGDRFTYCDYYSQPK